MITYIDSSKSIKEPFYVLVCIDEVSKFIFYSFLKRKLSIYVKQGFVSIIEKIRTMQKLNPIFSINENLIFYSDYGEEFMFKEVKKICESKHSKIINIGTPSVTKLGIIERAIRTLQEMMALSINDISNKYQYKNEIKKVINMYNKQKHSFIKMSPINFLKSEPKHLKPWNISSKKNETFDYFSNKKSIAKKLKKIKKEFPIMQTVRLYKKLKFHKKRSHFSTWSNEIYLIDGYKIPLLSESDIGLYLLKQNGKRMKGITYKGNVKKVKMSDYLQIKKVVSFMKKKKAIRCSFDNFPDDYYKDILLSELNNYIIPKKIRNIINNWREKNGI